MYNQFAKKEYRKFNNIFGWNNNNYLGIGTSASYYIDNKRYTNIKNLDLAVNNSDFSDIDIAITKYSDCEFKLKQAIDKLNDAIKSLTDVTSEIFEISKI